MKTLKKLLCLVIFCSLSLFSYAEIPHLINYQGRLTDKSGKPLEGNQSITLRIYDAENGGNMLWEETHPAVNVQKGIFNVLLGSTANLNLAFDKPYFLEIKVGDEIMSPRQRITSAGYAISAENLTAQGQKGDILYYDGTKWASLPHGTDGQYLKAQGDGANPTWAVVPESSVSSLGTSFLADTVYQNTRTRKIMIIAKTSQGGTNGAIAGYIGNSNPPNTKVAYQEGSYRHGGSITFIVPPNYYWKITDDTAGNTIDRIEAWEI